MSTGVKVELKGPIFSKMASHEVKSMMRGIIQELISTGEERLQKILRPRPGGVYLSIAEAGKRASKGNYRRNVRSEMRGSLHGVIDDSNCVYGPWLEGTSSRNQTTRFKGYSSFRKTGQWLQKQAPKIANAHTARFARKMS